jgi:hypothetical protein
MDPVARSTAQRAAKEARNVGGLASVALEESEGPVADDELPRTLNIRPEESAASPVHPQPTCALLHEVSVRYFIFF